MTVRPSGIDINGELYHLVDGPDAYTLVYEPALIRARNRFGTPTTQEVTRTDILEWAWSDWSRGEGQRWVDPDKGDHVFKQYLRSNGAVDVRIPGQLRLGLACTETLDLGASPGSAPHLVVGTLPVVVYGTNWRKFSGGSWGSALSTGSAQPVRGRVSAANGKIFVGTSTDIRRLKTGDETNTQWVSTEGRPVLVADKRVYVADAGTDKTVLRRVSLSSSGSGTDVTDLDGYEETVDIMNDGTTIFVLLGSDSEKPMLYSGQGTKGATYVEQVRLPDSFFVPQRFREVMTVLNGVLFIGGYFDNPHSASDDPALLWVKGNNTGIVGRIRERGQSEQIISVFSTIDNEVLMGTNVGNVYAYNMATGGFYQFADGIDATADVFSMCYDKGRFHFATNDTNAKLWATTKSGSGKYPSEVEVRGSRWALGTTEEKLFLDVTIGGSFPTNTSAEFSFLLNDGTEITTDADGNTMSATANATTFTISNATNERTFRWIEPRITLKTTDTSVTPIIYGVSMRFTTTRKVKFIECTVDLNDDNPRLRLPHRAITGAKASQELRDLIENENDKIVDIKPYFEKAHPPHPRDAETHPVILDQGRIEYEEHGRGKARLRFRVL